MKSQDHAHEGRQQPNEGTRAHRNAGWLFVLCLVLFVTWLISPATAQRNPREIPLAVIVVATEGEAQNVLQRLGKGEDFASLARQLSIDPTANQSGYIGSRDPVTLRPELRLALAGLQPGQTTKIVKIPAGYCVVRVLTGAPSENIVPTDPGRLQALSAQGALRLTADFSGYTEALVAFNRFDKAPGWEYDLHLACDARTQSAASAIDRLSSYIGNSGAGADAATLGVADAVLAHFFSYRGQMDQAIRYWDAAHELANGRALSQAAVLEESLGVAYLHRAGEGLYDKFVFPVPMKATAVTPAQKADLAKAAEYFLKVLNSQPDNTEVKWLLNLSHLLAGDYPAAVPANFLIAPATFQSAEDSARFIDVALDTGLNRYGRAGGAIIDDFDNDGLFDVVVSNMDDCEPLRYFHNNGDGRFTDRAAQAGLARQTGGLNIIQTDYNNDGCKDILILRGGWEYARRKSLLKNNCNGTFTDVTRESGLLSGVTSTQTAVWTDIDNDGNLDLFLGNENGPAQLFLNKGDGTFEDISHAAGIDQPGFTKAVVAADYDNDGYPDLFVSNFSGRSILYHNNHDCTFTEVSREAGININTGTFGAWFFDYDNDGWPDLFVAGYYASVEDVMFGYLGIPQEGKTLRLYKNLGGGKFKEVTAEVGLDRAFLPMGLNFGDIDNDGYLDFYLGSGNPSYATVLPNVLYRNKDGKRFVDITAASGTGVLPKGHGVAFADLNNDGQEDLYVVMGGATPGDRHTARLFANPGNANNWIGVHLVGVKSNRAAVGAQIKVTVQNGDSSPGSIYRTVGTGGSFGASPLEQHIGLGKTARIVSLEVWWPASNTRQTFAGPGTNQVIEVREFEKQFSTLKRRSFRFGNQLASVPN